MEKPNELWNFTIQEITDGYAETEYAYICVLCGKTFEKGRIYRCKEVRQDYLQEPPEDELYDAWGAVNLHIEREHGGCLSYMLQQRSSLTGISEVQQQILTKIAEGKSDREIASEAGIAASTVRNHRFKLREREKQAKIFLALMEALERKTSNTIADSDTGRINELHQSATMIDERYSITDQERQKTIRTYMDETGAIRQFPAKEKKKIVILREVMRNFKAGTDYTETEINRVLKRIYDEDHVAVRRALIEYGFLDRSADCRVYRVKE